MNEELHNAELADSSCLEPLSSADVSEHTSPADSPPLVAREKESHGIVVRKRKADSSSAALFARIDPAMAEKGVNLVQEVEQRYRELYCDRVPPADDKLFESRLWKSYGVQPGRSKPETMIVVQPLSGFDFPNLEFGDKLEKMVPLVVSAPLLICCLHCSIVMRSCNIYQLFVTVTLSRLTESSHPMKISCCQSSRCTRELE